MFYICVSVCVYIYIHTHTQVSVVKNEAISIRIFCSIVLLFFLFTHEIKMKHYIHTYTYTMEYYSLIKKEWNLAICNNVDGPRRYYLLQNTPECWGMWWRGGSVGNSAKIRLFISWALLKLSDGYMGFTLHFFHYTFCVKLHIIKIS